MSNVKDLWELQTKEQERTVLEKKLRTLPEIKELKKLKSEIEDSQYQIQGLKDQLVALSRQLKVEESQVALLKDKIAEANSQLYSGEITNSKELASAEKNIQGHQEKVGQAEEKELATMENIEKIEGLVNKLGRELESKKRQFRELNKGYNEKKAVLQADIAEISMVLETVTQRVEPELMKKYLRICMNFEDRKGVALLLNGICSGCHVSLSFDLVKQVRNGAGEISCDNCGRLLVAD